MDFDSMPSDAPIATPPQAAQQPLSFDQLPGDVHNNQSFDSMADDQDKYSTLPQQVKAGVEGAAQGVLGPLAPLIETQSMGVDPKDIRGREEANPWTHGLSNAAGFGASMLTGVGEAALVDHAAQALTGGMTAGKVAQGAAKMAAEMGMLSAGDETTKYLLDAPTSAGSALANIGLSAALGGATGGALGGLGKLASKGLEAVPEGLSEFTDRLKYRMTGANPGDALHNEFSNVFDTVKNLNDEVYGEQGLKSEAISKLAPERNDKMSDQMFKIGDDLTSKFADMDKNTEAFPQRLVNKAKDDFFQWKQVVDNPAATSKDLFDATNSLKQRLGLYSKFERQLGPLSPELDFANAAKELGSTVKAHLEDSKVWGDAANVQKQFNKAFSELKPFHDQVKKAFVSVSGKEEKILPETIESYMKESRSKGKALLKDRVKGFVDAFDKYQNAAQDIVQRAGIENPVPPVGLGAIRESLEQQSPWAKAADHLYEKGMSQASARLAGGAAGAYAGEKSGIPGGGYAGLMLGGAAAGSIVPSILQKLMESKVSATAFNSAIKFSEAVIKGNKTISKAAEGIFKAGSQPSLHYSLPNAAKLDKLDKRIDEVNNNPSQLISNNKDLSHYMPNHAIENMSQAGRAAQYLASIKPKAIQNSPLDAKQEPSPMQMAQYRRQLSIAEQPLQIMQYIKDGSLQPKDVATLNSVSPALKDQMAKMMMNHVQTQMESGDAIPYATRQSLSLFLGSPLDSTMTPQGIQAAQMTHAPKQPPQPQQSGVSTKKGATSKLGKSNNSYRTAEQSAEADRGGRDQ